jgi:hypothetical protein
MYQVPLELIYGYRMQKSTRFAPIKTTQVRLLVNGEKTPGSFQGAYAGTRYCKFKIIIR